MKKVKTPLRQSVPVRTCTKVYAKYGSFKKDLRVDFKYLCGYCADADSSVGYRNYHIDHFVPKVQLKKMKDNDYKNLVYSCFSCNNSKSSDWPSGDEAVAVIGDQGYIDPCNPDYDKQYYRDAIGNIIAQTELGRYMHDKLNLGLKRHSIIWALDILSEQIKTLKLLKRKRGLSAGSKEKLSRLLEKHYDYTEYLKNENNN